MKASKTVLARALFVVFVTAVSYPVSAQLKADFSATPQTGCAPLVVSFTDNSAGTPASWFWDLGNGVTSTQKNPNTYYFDPGVYTVKLVVRNGNDADSIVKTSYITVYQNPVAAFSISDSSGCSPVNVNFTNTSQPGSGAITSNVWDFGDGNTSTSAAPAHSYVSAGIFSVTLNVTNTYGCTNIVSLKNAIQVTQGVKAAFVYSTANVCHSPGNVVFAEVTETQGLSDLTYQWNFGDGTPTASGSPLTHNYIQAGNYRVLYKISAPGGCSDTISRIVSVAFVKSAISMADTICSNNAVQFINASSPAPSSSYWTFGDSTSATTISPSKTYHQNGNFTVQLVNVFFPGCTDTVSENINVIAAPQASFVVLDSAGCSLPFTAQFKNTSAGSGNTFIWDFGDGTTATTTDAVHQYTKYGSYTVSLKSFNSNGCDTVFTKVNAVLLQPIEITGVTGFSASKCIPAVVQPSLTTNIPVTIARYSWDFGDGTHSADSSPVHTYTVAGIYNIKVSIETVGGCTAVYTFADSVGQKLHPTFTVAPPNVCASAEVTFNNTTAANSTFLWWYPGDGSIIYNQPNPSHNYQDTGWFSPMLVVMQYGCYDTLIQMDAVHINGPIAIFAFANNCINKESVSFTDHSIEDISRIWNFGDGITDTSRNPVHVYKGPGTYTVSFFVTDSACTFTTPSTVQVVDEKGKISLSDSSLCRNSILNLAISGMNNANIDSTTWYMGNGNQVTELQSTNGTYSYTSNGTYTVYAVVKDILNCYDTLAAPFPVSVFGPHAKLQAQETGACRNGVIKFTDSSASDGLHPITLWKFNYGDTSFATYTTKTPFSHVYKDTGIFVATLAVTDNFGCSDSAQANPVDITQPFASFTQSDTVVCPGQPITFTNTTTGDSLTYNWVFGDGTQAQSISPVHLYTKDGTYAPRLYVTDINNCKDSATGEVDMNKPVAKFALSDSFSTCPPLDVNFTNQSENYVTFQWYFGDTNTSTIQSPEHVYLSPGTYAAKIIIMSNGGCSDTAVKNIVVQGPTGNFSYTQNQVCYPFTQKLAATSKNAVQYLWDYSDGITSTTSADSTSHIYQSGFYVPKLILIDAGGCKVPIIGTDTIKVYGIKTAAFANNFLLCDSGIVNFTDSSITNDVIKSSTWLFGDNSAATGTLVTHDYNVTGTYQVKLTDTTIHGCTGSSTVPTPVTVAMRPVISINGQTSFCGPSTVSLKAVMDKPDTAVLLWNWNFGNGDSSHSQNPLAVSYQDTGSYQVLVSATNSIGCSGSSFATINIHALPQLNAGGDTSICRNNPVNLYATGAESYIWGSSPTISCTACNNPLVIPDSTTTYAVTGKNQYGCTATDSVVVTVTQPVKITVSSSDTLCNGDTKQLTANGAEKYQWSPSTYLSDATAAQPIFSASKDTSITYSVVGYTGNHCFSDTAKVRVKVYPIPEMQVVQSNITASAGSAVQLSTINSPDVTKWKWTPAMWLDNPESPNPTAQPRESITYTVVAANDGACVTRAQVEVTVTCNGANIFVPNTFSPNGDGMNDVFYPRGTGLYNIKSFRIFNRWGQLIFERLNVGANSAADGWNGTFNGQPAPSDVYVYIIEVLCTNDTVIPVKGNVTLLR